jgi:tetratricopeptide (TPR) repeat protein
VGRREHPAGFFYWVAVDLIRRLIRGRRDRARGTTSNVPDRRPCPTADARESAVQRAIVTAAQASENGRYPEALRLLNTTANSWPRDQTLMYARACTLFSWGRQWEARRILEALKEAGFGHEGMPALMGWTYLATADPARAERHLREAVVASPENWEAHFGLGVCLRARDAGAALAEFERALDLAKDNVHCLVNMSACALDLKDAVLAERYARRAVKTSPANSSAWINLGLGLLLQDRLEQSLEAFESGEDLRNREAHPEDSDLHCGIPLRLLGRTDEAIAYYENHLARCPSMAASGHYALALLTKGRLRDGWSQYESRWLQEPLKSRRARSDRPAWRGQDLRGKILLLRCEQGAGDTIQFIRYAPSVKALGATVWLELRSGIGMLASVFPGIDKLYRPGDPIPDFDFHADLMSLPGVFGTTLESIPSDVPYLQAPEHARTLWRARLGNASQLRIGLVWAGDPRHLRDHQRSIPLATFAPLVRTEGARWFSLQKGIAAETLDSNPFATAVVDIGSELHDYIDTAAVIEQLDLVVTVDTSVAHLAGALGRPAWVLLPFAADWRWMENREDSPWYPSLRLFRQRRPDDWPEVLDRVQAALGRCVLDRRELSTHDAPVAAESGMRRAPEMHDPQQSQDVRGIPKVCRMRAATVQYIEDMDEAATSVAYYGEYLQTQIDVLSRLVAPGSLVVEIGAGIGIHTLALGAMVGPGGHVLAFENSPVLRRILRQNLAANSIHSVDVINGALTGEQPIAITGMPIDSPALDPETGAFSIDDLRLQEVTLLKITDPRLVWPVLGEATTMLRSRRPILFLAQGPGRPADAQLGPILDLGYQCWRIESSLFNRANFNRREDDIFLGRTGVAIVALPEEVDPGSLGAGMRTDTAVTPVTAV